MGIQDLLDELIGAPGGSDAEKDAAARDLAEKCGYAAAALTLLPIPGTELAVVPLHVGMVVQIGHIYEEEVTRDSAAELVVRIGATVGLSLVGSRVATTAAKVILPFLGGLLGAPFMYASTIAIGAVARLYFKDKGRLDDEQIRRIYRETLDRAREAFDPSRARSAQSKDLARAAAAEAKEAPGEPAPAAPQDDPVARLERLKALLDRGLIEPAEFEAVKRRILDAL